MKRLGNIRDVFKSIKHKKPTAIFCPRCGSPEIKLSSSLDYWLTPRKYYCPKCGYTGILVMELEPDETANQIEEAQEKEEIQNPAEEQNINEQETEETKEKPSSPEAEN